MSSRSAGKSTVVPTRNGSRSLPIFPCLLTALEQTISMKRKLRHTHCDSAAWGGRLALLLVLIVAITPATAQTATSYSSPTFTGTIYPYLTAITKAKISYDLWNAPLFQRVNVIVQWKTDPHENKFDRVKANGGNLRHRLNLIRAGAFTQLPAAALPLLAFDPDVQFISSDRKVAMTSMVPLTSSANMFPAQSVDADLAWATGFDGTGIGVAVIDSGVLSHPDLNDMTAKSRVVYSESFVPSDSSGADKYGHGTHVTGIIGGNAASVGYNAAVRGVAPNANIIDLRALDQNGSGTDSSVIAAIQRAIQLKDKYNIRIINLSLGRGIYESYKLDPLCQAVEQAWKAGIAVVVAAGNDGRDNTLGTQGYGTINAPGNDPYVITVGATDTSVNVVRINDTIASFSSKGPTLIDHVVKPDVVAPGNRIISLRAPGSTLDVNYAKYEISLCDGTVTACVAGTTPMYFRLSGTSMSTPMVSGALALLFQAQPQLTPDQAKARLMKTAWKGFTAFSTTQSTSGAKFQNQYDIFTYGSGYVDIAAALNSTDVATGSAMSPTAVYNPLTNTVSLSTDPTSVWNSSVLWGSSIVWGSNLFVNSSSVLWGSSVIWGANNTSSFSVLWGSSIIWGSANMQSLSDGEDGEDPPDATTTDTTTDSTITPTI
jgi:serine protease AprX